jgi:flagellar biosynthesis protein
MMRDDLNYLKKVAALKYDNEVDDAPRLTAKGQGEVAKQIISIAKEHNIPIKEDADLVELLSKLEVDQEIPTELYKAIAEIFGFIYELNSRNLAE